MNEITITIVGNVTADPELRFTPTGKPVTTVRVAHTPRRFDTRTQEWVDGEPTFMRCEVWNGAENVAESLTKGHRVIVTGRLETERFTPREGDQAGQEITVHKVVVDEIGPTLRWATATPVRNRTGDAAPAPAPA
jgi:single-strand DNA-binding protein